MSEYVVASGAADQYDDATEPRSSSSSITAFNSWMPSGRDDAHPAFAATSTVKGVWGIAFA
jgi:hypothetical protein